MEEYTHVRFFYIKHTNVINKTHRSGTDENKWIEISLINNQEKPLQLIGEPIYSEDVNFVQYDVIYSSGIKKMILVDNRDMDESKQYQQKDIVLKHYIKGTSCIILNSRLIKIET